MTFLLWVSFARGYLVLVDILYRGYLVPVDYFISAKTAWGLQPCVGEDRMPEKTSK